jgi:AcrR family transcriptional regulator
VTETPTVDRRARRHARTRAEILEASWELAERDGIAGLSLRDVAGRVGMRAPSLYTYFDGKAAIYDAMFVDGYGQLDADLDRLYGLAAAEPRDALTRAIAAFIAFCQASVPRYQLMFTRVIPVWEPSPAAYAASLASYERMVAGLERIGVRDRAAVDLFTALTAGLAAQQLANDLGGDRWIRLAGDAAEMLLTYGERRPS